MPSKSEAALSIAVQIIADFEGFSAHPYQDSGGIYTIGYGATYTPDKCAITADTPPISQDEARAWLGTSVSETLAIIRAVVHVPITDNQAAALTSLAYNIGNKATRDSSLMTFLNLGKYQEAGDAFLSWVYVGKRISAGLVARRKRERALFLTDAPAPELTKL